MSAQPDTGITEINTDLVRRLIAEQFPRWAHLPVRPVEVGGWDTAPSTWATR
ncbi:hypothetical protein [Micromonospora sp. WMMC250]|uniref:hypothetical protein n=1 Tax=Micromonospora sp. WMMC250 TaxID=3014781 RepID=UPI0022B6CAFD|nr:hypothetical protein [Micromonospora sp. WMMC250]MCZ7374485.1 hypothetical protein [Micromonospora sp. WMMC250]